MIDPTDEAALALLLAGATVAAGIAMFNAPEPLC